MSQKFEDAIITHHGKLFTENCLYGQSAISVGVWSRKPRGKISCNECYQNIVPGIYHQQHHCVNDKLIHVCGMPWSIYNETLTSPIPAIDPIIEGMCMIQTED